MLDAVSPIRTERRAIGAKAKPPSGFLVQSGGGWMAETWGHRGSFERVERTTEPLSVSARIDNELIVSVGNAAET
jgi:hypothetical protein